MDRHSKEHTNKYKHIKTNDNWQIEKDKRTVANVKRQCYGRHTLDLEMAPYVSVAPVYHTSVLRLRREKLHPVQVWSSHSLRIFRTLHVSSMKSKHLNYTLLVLKSVSLTASSLNINTLSMCFSCCFENPVMVSSKALRKPDYVITSWPMTFKSWHFQDRKWMNQFPWESWIP